MTYSVACITPGCTNLYAEDGPMVRPAHVPMPPRRRCRMCEEEAPIIARRLRLMAEGRYG